MQLGAELQTLFLSANIQKNPLHPNKSSGFFVFSLDFHHLQASDGHALVHLDVFYNLLVVVVCLAAHKVKFHEGLSLGTGQFPVNGFQQVKHAQPVLAQLAAQ